MASSPRLPQLERWAFNFLSAAPPFHMSSLDICPPDSVLRFTPQGAHLNGVMQLRECGATPQRQRRPELSAVGRLPPYLKPKLERQQGLILDPGA